MVTSRFECHGITYIRAGCIENMLILAHSSFVISGRQDEIHLSNVSAARSGQCRVLLFSDYASGAVHQKPMKLKNDQWAHDAAEGKQDPRQWLSWKDNKGSKKDRVKCKDGLAVVEAGNANQTFRCNNVSA